VPYARRWDQRLLPRRFCPHACWISCLLAWSAAGAIAWTPLPATYGNACLIAWVCCLARLPWVLPGSPGSQEGCLTFSACLNTAAACCLRVRCLPAVSCLRLPHAMPCVYLPCLLEHLPLLLVPAGRCLDACPGCCLLPHYITPAARSHCRVLPGCLAAATSPFCRLTPAVPRLPSACTSPFLRAAARLEQDALDTRRLMLD